MLGSLPVLCSCHLLSRHVCLSGLDIGVPKIKSALSIPYSFAINVPNVRRNACKVIRLSLSRSLRYALYDLNQVHVWRSLLGWKNQTVTRDTRLPWLHALDELLLQYDILFPRFPDPSETSQIRAWRARLYSLARNRCHST